MTELSLAKRLGRMFKMEREVAGLSQEALALRMGVSQQHLSRFERGVREPTAVVVERMFEGLGLTVEVDAVPIGRDLDETVVDIEAGKKLWARQIRTLEFLGKQQLPGQLDGLLAALMLGLSVNVRRIDLVIEASDLDKLAAWIGANSWLRYDERNRDFDDYDASPLRPDRAWRWRSNTTELRVRMFETLPPPVMVSVEESLLAVRPLEEVAADEPLVARILEHRISPAEECLVSD